MGQDRSGGVNSPLGKRFVAKVKSLDFGSFQSCIDKRQLTLEVCMINALHWKSQIAKRLDKLLNL